MTFSAQEPELTLPSSYASLDLSLIEDVIDKLNSLKTAMKDTEAIITDQLTRVTCQHASVLNTQNTTIKLPVELLGIIFSHACDVTPPTISRRWWDESGIANNTVDHTRLSIELTCIHWRTVLHSTPNTWKNTVFSFPEDPSFRFIQQKLQMMFTQLQRSKSPKRRIFVDALYMDIENPEALGLLNHFGLIFVDEQLSIETLAIRTSQPLDWCTSWLFNKPPFPLLHTLCVEWNENIGQMDLDLSSATQLQVLILTYPLNSADPNITLSILCPYACNISELHLRGSISMVDAFQIITQNKGSLQELYWVAWSNPTSEVLPTQEPSSFPRLQKLILDIHTPELMLDIYTFPALETLIFRAHSMDYLDKARLPILRFLKTDRLNRSSLVDYLSENKHIEEICFHSLDEATLNGLIPLISPSGDDDGPSGSTPVAGDPLPNLAVIYVKNWVSSASIEELFAASRRRRRPFITFIADPTALNRRPKKGRKTPDILLEEYPDVFQHGSLPPRFCVDIW
ncbi:hypothetical protein DL93DRAFT_1325058 [Clavulina sp. PMI_390]|nr:hypothetical protein DL93DRAFT_1325058 [Clavulina sp. PMI_390]